MSATPLLSVERVSKNFGGLVANSDISFEVAAGEIKALIGPNGAGKTTLFNIISGFYAPSAGRIAFAGQDIVGMAQHRIAALGLTRTFQLVQLFRDKTAAENVAIGFHLRSRGGILAALLRLKAARTQERRIRAEARELLAFVGLERQAALPAGALTYGQQRLLELARALATRPKLLLLDEPAAGLTPPETETLSTLIRRVNSGGVTILLIEHDMRFVMTLAQSIVVVDFGRKIAEGSPAEVQVHPAVVVAYLGGEADA
jgi:branched-chain amino acid transport system ATP-binding protein